MKYKLMYILIKGDNSEKLIINVLIPLHAIDNESRYDTCEYSQGSQRLPQFPQRLRLWG